MAWRRTVVLALCGVMVSSMAWAVPIKAFVPDKPWEVTVALAGFEPDDVLGPETILGGTGQGDIIITVLIEKAGPGTTAKQAREQYGKTYAFGAGAEKTFKTCEIGDMAVILYPWKSPKPTWGFNGYKIKEDVLFDVHISADLGEHSEEEILGILKSFDIKPSTEPEETANLAKKLQPGGSEPDAEKTLSDFAQKFPGSPWVYYMLGEHYFAQERLAPARDAYLKALENHKAQPIMNPFMTWGCYDGLGLCYGMSKEYGPSKTYFERGYELAQDLEEPKLLAASAYNLACWHAENRAAKESVEYLTEAIKYKRANKKQAKSDPSFDAIRETDEFKQLMNP